MESSPSLTHFTLQDMAICMRTLRRLGTQKNSMEAVADNIVRYLFECFQNPESSSKELALVRFYKVHEFGNLPPELMLSSGTVCAGRTLDPETKCLVLLASAGQESSWNSRKNSVSHKVLPLSSMESVRAMPMVYSAISQLGFEVSKIISPEPGFMVAEESQSYNVFYVPVALGCPFIPAQDDFVVPFGIESVLGFGGLLPSGNLFVVILFSKVRIPVETAEIFKSLAISAKVAVVAFDENKRVFSAEP